MAKHSTKKNDNTGLWVAGGLVAAGLAYWYWKKQQAAATASTVPTTSSTSLVATVEQPIGMPEAMPVTSTTTTAPVSPITTSNPPTGSLVDLVRQHAKAGF